LVKKTAAKPEEIRNELLLSKNDFGNSLAFGSRNKPRSNIRESVELGQRPAAKPRGVME
jgi:hypothetical protein